MRKRGKRNKLTLLDAIPIWKPGPCERCGSTNTVGEFDVWEDKRCLDCGHEESRLATCVDPPMLSPSKFVN